MEVIVALHRLLYAQLKDVGEITGGIKPKINYRVSNAEGVIKQRDSSVRGAESPPSLWNRINITLLTVEF